MEWKDVNKELPASNTRVLMYSLDKNVIIGDFIEALIVETYSPEESRPDWVNDCFIAEHSEELYTEYEGHIGFYNDNQNDEITHWAKIDKPHTKKES